MATLATSERFFQPETSKVYFVPTIASTALEYTLVERDAGVDLTGEIADISGWNITSAMIATPDLGSKFNSQIGGRTSVDASSITFWADKSGVDARAELPRETTGYIVFADGGDTAGYMSDVFPVSVTSVGKLRSVGDNAFQVTITFAVTAEPLEDYAIPAA